MNERLQHLQRQHVLLREHLAWIETEIAKEAVPTEINAPRVTAWAPAPPPSAPAPTPSMPAAEPIDADALIERYADTERQRPADVRRGCLLTFAGLMALITIVILGVWWLRYR